MEAGRLIYQPVRGLSGAGFDGRCSLKSPPRDLCIGNARVSFRPRSYTRSLSHGFSDSGHVQYYESPSRCVGEKSAEMKAEKKKKKKLKLMKRLSKDLASFSIGEVNGKNTVSVSVRIRFSFSLLFFFN
uniref:Uncharacterized protein n=1 Tax=Rhizophora mucronata TaxID=61149 RepID=A0A2P2J9K7_RHIMU